MNVRVLVLALLSACAGSRSPLPYYRSAALTPEWLPDGAAAASDMHRVAAFTARDQHGDVISDRALDGKITIAHFFFTACGDVCPITTANIRDLLDTLKDNTQLQVLSYSVTPVFDSVATLRAYAARRGISDPRWHLLTAPAADIQRLARESYFVRLGDGATYGVKTIEHTETVVLVDQQRRIRGVYSGTLPLEMARLRQDVSLFLANR